MYPPVSAPCVAPGPGVAPPGDGGGVGYNNVGVPEINTGGVLVRQSARPRAWNEEEHFPEIRSMSSSCIQYFGRICYYFLKKNYFFVKVL